MNDYEVKNVEMARNMIKSSLDKLIGEKLFGSGWKIYPMDYPHVRVFDDYIAIYDMAARLEEE